MDELLKELANLLHLSQDSLVKLGESYPALRNQYIVYSIASNFSILAFFAAIASIIIVVYANSIESNADYLSDERSQHAIARSKKWMKLGMILAISAASIFVISNTAAAIFAPDINLIRDIVANMKGN